jgi:hypothetical protein
MNDKCELPYDLTLYSILPENVFSISKLSIEINTCEVEMVK